MLELSSIEQRVSDLIIRRAQIRGVIANFRLLTKMIVSIKRCQLAISSLKCFLESRTYLILRMRSFFILVEVERKFSPIEIDEQMFGGYR